MTIFTKETNSGFGTGGSIIQNPQFLHFLEKIDRIQFRNILQAQQYHRKAIKKVLGGQEAQKVILRDNPSRKNASIWRMVKNPHLTLTFSQAKSFCSTYFKFWEFVEKLSGFTVPKFVLIEVKLWSVFMIWWDLFFLGHPVATQTYHL